MKKILLGFAEGYFIVSLIIYHVFDFEKTDQYLVLSRNLSDSTWSVLYRIQVQNKRMYDWKLMDHQIGVWDESCSITSKILARDYCII